MHKYISKTTGHVYDPAVGDAASGIEPGVPFEILPEDWTGPDGSKKEDYEPEEGTMPGMVIPMDVDP